MYVVNLVVVFPCALSLLLKEIKQVKYPPLTESQGWKGPEEIIESNPPAKAG